MPRTGENIYKRKDGRWEGRYIKKHTAAKPCYGYIYGKTYRDVKARLIQAKLEWESQQMVMLQEKKNDTLSNIANAWLENSRLFFKESTLVKYQNLLASYILPILGNCNISRLTNEVIYEFTCSLLNTGGTKGNGLSPKTVSDSLSLLRSILKFAADKNMKVVYTACSMPVKQSKKQLRVFSVREQQVLCQYLMIHMTLSNLGILLCLFTGIRVGELCALRWEDISIQDKTLCIHQTMQRLRVEGNNNDMAKTRVLISAPKSSSSIRVIPLPDMIMEKIIAMRQVSDSFFLTGDKERFVEPRTMQNRFKSILKSCNISDAHFHTLRHTFATRCVEVGFDVKSLSEILGHANVNITLNRYVHPTLEQKQKNMSRLSELFSVK